MEWCIAAWGVDPSYCRERNGRPVLLSGEGLCSSQEKRGVRSGQGGGAVNACLSSGSAVIPERAHGGEIIDFEDRVPPRNN